MVPRTTNQLPQMVTPPQSTGERKTPSPQSRTKDNVDHAGLSQPPVQLKVSMPSPTKISSPSPNNNSLIAPNLMMVTKVAMVEKWILLSNTSKPTKLKKNQTTDIKESMALATTMPQRESSALKASLMFLKATLKNLRTLLPRDQSQLPLKLIPSSSNSTVVVSSAVKAAEPTSTTVSWLLVMELKTEKTTGLSRTHGAQAGENPDSSDSPREEMAQESAVSNSQPHTPPSEEIDLNHTHHQNKI